MRQLVTLALASVLLVALATAGTGVQAEDAASNSTLRRPSGRHPGDVVPLGVLHLPSLLAARSASASSSPLGDLSSGIAPTPFQPGENAIGGDSIDDGAEGGPTQNPIPDWNTLTQMAAQYFAGSQAMGMAFQSGPQLYLSSVATLDLDLTGLFPVSPRQQGDCNSCWAHAAAEHLQALLILRGWIAGPFVGTQNPQPIPMYPNQPMYHRLSVQQIIGCAMLNGCWGGSVVNAFRWMITGQPDQPQIGVTEIQNYQPEDGYKPAWNYDTCSILWPNYLPGLQVADPPTYQPGPAIAMHVIPPCTDADCPASLATENAVLAYMTSTNFPLIAYVDASNWANFAAGSVFPASGCSSSGQPSNGQHVIQIVGHGTDAATGAAFWLIRNSWGPDWCEGGFIRLQFGTNTCGLMNYLVQADPPAQQSSKAEA